MIKIYISKYHDVYTNIAIERYLFEKCNDDLTIFLWRNKPCVVFGRNQNIYNEVDVTYANQKNINLARRFSGGGAVYQDMGNLNYTFYCKSEEDIKDINDMIIKVFKSLDINAYFSGRNDLLTNDRKFSGIAYCNDFDHVMYHGTCLVDVDQEKLTKVLKPHDYKLISHSVSSYKSRVINLKEIKDITCEEISNAFIIITRAKDDIQIIEDIVINKEVQTIINKLKDKDYIFNDCPKYSYPLQIKLNNSNYHFDIEYDNGKISNVNVYSDDLDVSKKEFYQSKLLDKEISIDQIKTYLECL